MAFSLQVQPQAGQNIGQGILMAAQGIAQGMNKYYQRKEENDQIAKAADMFSVAAQQNPFLAQAMGIQDVKDTAAIKNAIKGAGGPGKFTQIASGIHEMSMQAARADAARREMEIQNQRLLLAKAENDRQQADAARKDALYQQGQAQVADMRMVNDLVNGGGSPLSNEKQAELRRRLQNDPMLAQQAAAVASTGMPMDAESVARLRMTADKAKPNLLFRTQAEAEAALKAGGGRGSVQLGANGWSVRTDSGPAPATELERLIDTTVKLEEKTNRTPAEDKTLNYYKEVIKSRTAVDPMKALMTTAVADMLARQQRQGAK